MKELTEHGVEATGIEAGSQLGGKWAGEWDVQPHGIWDELRCNDWRAQMEYSDFPWTDDMFPEITAKHPDLRGLFPHWSEAKAYLQAYAEHFNVTARYKFQTRVTKLERGGDVGWTVHTQHTNGDTAVNQYDAVIISSGRHSKPTKIPLLGEGGSLTNFTGKVLHSSEFRSLSMGDGQRVLVVGSYISGSDIAAQIAAAKKATLVDNSVRHVPMMMDRVSPVNQKPCDDVMFQRMPYFLGKVLPDKMMSQGLQGTLLANFPNQITAEDVNNSPHLPITGDIQTQGLSYAVSYVDNVRAGNLRIVPAVKSSEGNTVTFVDGRTEQYDMVICATGWEVDLSILPEEVREKVAIKSSFTGNVEPALYKHTLHPAYDDLAFMGLFNAAGASFPSLEMQARYLALLHSGKHPMPSIEARQAGVAAFKSYRGCGRHNAVDPVFSILEPLASEMNWAPSFCTSMCSPSKYLTGPIFACSYRMRCKFSKPEKVKAAAERWEELMKEPKLARPETSA